MLAGFQIPIVVSGAPPATGDPATDAWINAVVAAGGSVSGSYTSGRQKLVNDLIVGLKGDGVFADLDRLWLLAAENSQSALVDLIAVSAATVSGTPTFTADRGYTGNGTNGKVTGAFNPATTPSPKFVQNSACIFGWSNTTGTDAGGFLGIGSSTIGTRLFTESSGRCYWDANTSGGIGNVHTSVRGLYVVNRSAASGAGSSTLYVNGASVFTNTAASIAVVNDSINALIAPGNAATSTKQCCAFGIGRSMVAAKQTSLYTRLRTYMTAVGVP